MAEKKRVVIVEDDLSLYNLYATELSLKGYVISNVPEGNSAVDVLRKEKPDLVILDLMLPGRSGLDILQDLKADPELKNLRVIMLTNFSNEDHVNKALELGAEDYMLKYTLVPSDLSDKVSLILGDSSGSIVKVTN